jgi:hypothetical protein
MGKILGAIIDLGVGKGDAILIWGLPAGIILIYWYVST